MSDRYTVCDLKQDFNSDYYPCHLCTKCTRGMGSFDVANGDICWMGEMVWNCDVSAPLVHIEWISSMADNNKNVIKHVNGYRNNEVKFFVEEQHPELGSVVTSCPYYLPLEEGEVIDVILDNDCSEKELFSLFAKKRYQCYMESKAWQRKRRERFKIDNYQCQLCGSAKNLQCHHLTYETLFDEDMEDLLTVCKSCHQKLHKADIDRR